jgi:hypothetical protein
MWDTTALNRQLSKVRKKVEVRGIPHLAKNERDVGHPSAAARTEFGHQTIGLGKHRV